LANRSNIRTPDMEMEGKSFQPCLYGLDKALFLAFR